MPYLKKTCVETFARDAYNVTGVSLPFTMRCSVVQEALRGSLEKSFHARTATRERCTKVINDMQQSMTAMQKRHEAEVAAAKLQHEQLLLKQVQAQQQSEEQQRKTEKEAAARKQSDEHLAQLKHQHSMAQNRHDEAVADLRRQLDHANAMLTRQDKQLNNLQILCAPYALNVRPCNPHAPID
jgi:hypothetical protein